MTTLEASTHLTIFRGTLAGLAGGTAEAVWITIYSALTGGDPRVVAAGVATAIGSGAGSPVQGLIVHMLLSVALGIGLVLAWEALRKGAVRGDGPYVFMLCALTAVWIFNFLVLLPLISPEFPKLLPYPVTLISKLLFAIAAAAVLQIATGAMRDGFARKKSLPFQTNRS